MRLRTLLLTAAVTLPSVAHAADWPQWRGPNRDGVSTETGLLDTWPKEGPKLLWQVDKIDGIGTGYGSPAVVGDKLFIIGADGAKKDAKEFVTCLTVKDGSKVWQTKLTTSNGDFLDQWGGGPRATPTVDGDHLDVLGATGDLACLTADKGEIKWQKNLAADLGGPVGMKPWWGYSESPLVDGDVVVCTPGGKGGMAALNKKTGEVVWQCKDIGDNPGYSSVVVAEVGGVKQYVQQTMASAVGVRAKDGKLLWKAGGIKRAIAVIPTPVVHDGYAFFTAGYGAGCECFKLEKDGDGTKATEVYTKNKVVANHHGGVVRLGEFVYGHSDSNGWVCFDFKKGGDEPVWKNKGVGKGACTAAGGMLYCYGEQKGELALVKATDKGYEEAGKFTIPATSTVRPRQGLVWAHPVIANGKLYLRDYERLYVYDVAKAKS